MIDASALPGEQPWVPECVVLAPATGVFRLLPGRAVTEGAMVFEGDTIGLVESSGETTPVRTRFSGFLMGMLAHGEERVREGQPVAWLRNVPT